MSRLLVVVDYQKDFVDGSLGFKKAESLEKGIYKKVSEYLNNGDKVLFTYDTHEEDYLKTREGINLPVVHCVDGSEGHSLYGSLKNFEGDERVIFLKKKSFGISPLAMEEIKENLKEVPESIELVGVVTNICVISNAITFQAQYINTDIIVDASLCASFDDNLHEKALDVLEGLQIKVTNRE